MKKSLRLQTAIFCFFAMLSFQVNAQNSYLIDFGASATASDAPWNNITNASLDSVIMLSNTDGTMTGVGLSVVDRFNGVNTSGTQEPDAGLGLPATASGDSFFGNVAPFAGLTEPTGGIELTGLTVGTPYTFTIFASRTATDSRETQYLIEGASAATVVLQAASNTSEVATATMMPDANGTILVTAAPGPGNDNSFGFYYMGSMEVTEQVAPPESLELLVDFGASATESDAPWNNITNASLDSVIMLTDTDGAMSGVGLSVVDRFNGINTSGTQEPDAGLGLPATASGDSFFGNVEPFSGLTEPTGGVELTGLTVGTAYTFTIFASRTATDNRETQYLIEGASAATVALQSASNTSEVATATMMPDANGTILVTASPGPNNDNSFGFYYMGSMKITSGDFVEPPVVLTGDILYDWEVIDTNLLGVASFGNGHFGTSPFDVIANPSSGGINTSATVYEWCKANDGNTWGGIFFDAIEPIDLSGTATTLCLDVLMPHNGDVLLKLEGSLDGDGDVSLTMAYTGNGEWQQICYDFTTPDGDGDVAAGRIFPRFTIFLDFGNTPAEDECHYFDNFIQVDVPVVFNGNIIADWETDETTPAATVFGGATIAETNNPSADAVNGSDDTFEFCKDENSQTWAGFGFTMTDTLDVTGDMATVCLSMYADAANTVLLKLEGATDGSDAVSFNGEYTTPGEWQVICYDLTLPGVDDEEAFGHLYTKLTIFPDFGGNATACYYIDDIQKSTNGTGVLLQFITNILADSPDHTMVSSFIATADIAPSINANGVTFFAPTDAAFSDLSSAELDALSNNVDGALYNMLLHHVTHDSLPEDLLVDGIHIMRNGQDGTIAGSAINGADITTSTVAVNGYVHSVESVMAFPNDPAVYIHGDYESEEFAPIWLTFGSIPQGHETIANHAPDANNDSPTVAKYIKYNYGATWQGGYHDLRRPVNLFNDRKELCMDVWFEAPGFLRIKMENSPTGAEDARWVAETTVAMGWNQICWDLSTPDVNNAIDANNHIYDRIAIFFDFENDAPLPEEHLAYYVDNFIQRSTNPDAVNNISQLENFKYYPNPASDVLTIESDTPIQSAVVYDISGRKLMTVENPIENSIAVSQLHKGMYFIDFLGENNGRLGTIKFIKE